MEGYIKISVECAEVFQLLSGEKRPESEVRASFPAQRGGGGEVGVRSVSLEESWDALPHCALSGVLPCCMSMVCDHAQQSTVQFQNITSFLQKMVLQPRAAGPHYSRTGTFESILVESTSHWRICHRGGSQILNPNALAFGMVCSNKREAGKNCVSQMQAR